MKNQGFVNCMSPVTEIIFTQSGPVRSCTGREIPEKNSMEFWSEICVRFMILQRGKDMKFGWCKDIFVVVDMITEKQKE